MGDGQIWVNKIRGKIRGNKQGNKKRASSVYTRVRRGLYFPSEKTGLRMKTDYTPF